MGPEAGQDASTACVLVDDLGSTGFAATGVVARAFQRDPREVAELILTAPSQLVGPLERGMADQVAATLREIGLTARTVDPDARWSPGNGNYEIALSLTRFEAARSVLVAVCSLLGCAPEVGLSLLVRTPAVILAGLSRRNVDVLERRFSALGVELDVSDARTATYEVVVTPRSAQELAASLRIARTADIELSRQADGRTHVAARVPRQHAVDLVESLSAGGIPVRALDTAFQRFDVVLDRLISPDRRAGLAAALEDVCGVPTSLAERVAATRGIVVARQRRWAETSRLLAALHEHGGVAHAEMVGGLLFDIEISEVGDGTAAVRALEDIGKVTPVRSATIGRGRPGRVDGPFTYHQAHWLQAELAQSGTRASLRKVDAR